MGQFDAGALSKQFGGKMRQAANDGRVEHLARFRFGERDQLFDTVDVARGIDDQHHGALFEQSDRRKILRQIDRRIGIDDLVGDDRQGGKEHRVAVLGRVRDIFGGDARSGARLILDDDLLAEDWSAALGENASGHIGGCSRREPHNHMDRARRISVIRHGRSRRERQRGRTGRQMQKSATDKFHGVSSQETNADGRLITRT